MNPYLRLKPSSYLGDAYLYASGLLESSWPEVGIDLSNPPVISAKVVDELSMNHRGVSDGNIALYLNQEPMKVTVAASKRVGVNQHNHKAEWINNGWSLPQIKLLSISGSLLILFEEAVSEAFRYWDPPIPSFENTKTFLLNKSAQNILFEINLWTSLLPPSVIGENWMRRGRGVRRTSRYISFVHWFDGNTYFVVRGLDELFTDARTAVMACYKALMLVNRLTGLTAAESQDDVTYLETFIEELIQSSGGGNVPLV